MRPIQSSFLLIIACLCSVVSAFAANFSGKVVNSADLQPVEFASIAAFSMPDSTLLASTLTDEKGEFTLASPTTKAVVRISAIGFPPTYIPFSDNGTCTIRLNADGRLLDEVTVTASRPTTRIVGNALVTDIANSLLAKIGTAADALANVPGIVKDKDGFNVLGKGTPLIYLNGRQLRDLSELDRIRSEEIKSVEVSTNPGARYDATVKAVVKIHTLPRKGDGISLDLNSTYSQSQNVDLLENAGINYRHENLDIFGRVSYNRYAYLQDSEINQDNYNDSHWHQSNDYYTHGVSHNLFAEAGFNYQFNESHSTGLRYQLSATPSDKMWNESASTVEKDGMPYDKLLTSNFTQIDSRPTHALNGYYWGKIGIAEIDFNADLFFEKRTTLTDNNETSSEGNDRLLHSTNDAEKRLLAEKLVVTLPLGGGNLQFGNETSHTFSNDDYWMNDATVVPSSFSKITELNAGTFAEYTYSFQKISLTGGVRHEFVNFNYYENGVKKEEQCRHFNNFYPNASLTFQNGQFQTLLSYNTKTQRPSYTQLSNNVSYVNRLTMQTGNPTLEPTTVHDLSLTAVWKFLQASLDYQLYRNAVVYSSRPFTNDPSAVLLSYENLDRLPVLSATVSASPTVGFWNPTGIVNIRKQYLSVEHLGTKTDMSRPMFTAILNNAFRLPKGFTAFLNFRWQSKGDYQNVAMTKNIYCLDISVTKSFFNDALTVELKGNDLLNRSGDCNLLRTANFQIAQNNRYDRREFVATVRYKFNATPSKYKGSGAGQSEKDRL